MLMRFSRAAQDGRGARDGRGAQDGRGKQRPYNRPTVRRTVFAVLPVVLLAVAAIAAFGAPPETVKSAPPIRFSRDIRPILSDNCFSCHGADKTQRQAGLRLDIRAEAVKFGAFVPGKPEKSDLVARLSDAQPDEQMPPPASRKTLTRAQKALLTRWIAEGAPYEDAGPPPRPKAPARRRPQISRPK